MNSLKYLVVVWVGFLFSSCQQQSLQKNLVDKQEDNAFLKVDIAPNSFGNLMKELNEEEQQALKNIQKINLLAYPIDSSNVSKYESETRTVEAIFEQEKYQELTRVRSENWNANFYFTGGDVTSIEELIIYANDSQKGFAIARVHGKDIQLEHLIKLIQVADSKDMDLSGFSEIMNVFNSSEISRVSINSASTC